MGGFVRCCHARSARDALICARGSGICQGEHWSRRGAVRRPGTRPRGDGHDASHDGDKQHHAELRVSQHKPGGRQPCASQPLGITADPLLRQVAGDDGCDGADQGRMNQAPIPVTRLAIARRLVSAGHV